MDWDLKMPPWDLAELEPNAEPNIRMMIRPSNGLDCSVDLKLGGLGDLGSSQKWRDHQRTSPSSSLKRTRATANGSQNVACLVDGCKSDLSNCREYHRRHKVCEVHSKTPIVLVRGQEQRFCQQCSRFHLLVEFDEVKRSCRKRLDGHNRRRRKPQPDSNFGSLFTNRQGNRFSSYHQMFTAATSDATWPVGIKTEDSEPTICQPLLRSTSPVTVAGSSSSTNNNNKIFSLDSDCALSLLSSSPPQSSAFNVSQIVPSTDRVIPMGQPLISYGGGLGLGRYSSSRQGFSCPRMEDENVGSSSVLAPEASNHEMNCHELFGVGGDGSSDAVFQALPFTW